MTGDDTSQAFRSTTGRSGWNGNRGSQYVDGQLLDRQHWRIGVSSRDTVWSQRISDLPGNLSTYLLTGHCLGADIQTAYTAPSHWFKKKRGLCTGIASCGGGLGGAAFALVSLSISKIRYSRWQRCSYMYNYPIGEADDPAISTITARVGHGMVIPLFWPPPFRARRRKFPDYAQYLKQRLTLSSQPDWLFAPKLIAIQTSI